MTFSFGPRGLGIFVALCCLSAQEAVHSAEPPTPEETAIKLDGIIESLKKEAVDFNSEAQDIEQSVLYPLHSRVSVFISCKISQLLLQNVTITVDDNAPVRYDYSERSARALLLSEGLHRIALSNVEPGRHRIRAEFRGQFADADKNDPPVAGRFEAEFDKTRKPVDLELRIARNSRLAKPQMALVLWKVGTPEPESKSSRSKSRRVRTPRP